MLVGDNEDRPQSGLNSVSTGGAILLILILFSSVALVTSASATTSPEAERNSPDFAVSSEEGESVEFSIDVSDDDGNLGNVEWYIDGNRQTTNSINGFSDTDTYDTTFDSEGTYLVAAVVYNDEWEKSDRISWEVTVEADENQPPESQIESPRKEITIEEGESPTFTVSAEDPDGELVGTEWYVDHTQQEVTWGLSGSSDTDEWDYTFDKPGEYTVEADVFDDKDAYNDEAALWTVTVEEAEENNPPRAERDSPDFSVTREEGKSVEFNVDVFDDDGNLRNVDWYIDGDYQTTNPVRDSRDVDSYNTVFSNDGKHYVSAVVYDEQGLEGDTISWEVTVKADENQPPESQIESPDKEITIEEGESPTFTVSAEDPDGELVGTEWYVDHTQQEVTWGLSGSSDTDEWGHTFDKPGEYTVEADVFDDEDVYNDEAALWTVIVKEEENKPPRAERNSPDFSVTREKGESVEFGVDVSDNDGNLRNVEWYIDGNHQTSNSVSGSNDRDTYENTFNSKGTFLISAVVFDEKGFEGDTISWEITVEADENQPPESQIEAPDKVITLEEGESQTFTVGGEDSDGELVGTEWYVDHNQQDVTWGLSGSSDTEEWDHTFDEPGEYTVEADVFNSQDIYNDEAVTWEVTVKEKNTPPEAERNSPGQDFTVDEGESTEFSIDISDDDGNLKTVEWSIDGNRQTNNSISGSSGLATYNNSFNNNGEYIVSAVTYDESGGKSDTISWDIVVKANKTEDDINRVHWDTGPPSEVGSQEPFDIEVAGQIGDEGTVCLYETDVYTPNEIACHDLSSGGFEKSFAVSPVKDLMVGPGETTELYAELNVAGSSGENMTTQEEVFLNTEKTLSVQVFEKDGSPASFRSVQLTRAQKPRLTNRSGEVTFSQDIEPHDRIVIYDGGGTSPSKIVYPVSPTEEDIEIQLGQTQTVSGVVMDENGSPIKNARLETLRGNKTAIADENGTFEFQEQFSIGKRYYVDIYKNGKPVGTATLRAQPGLEEYRVQAEGADFSGISAAAWGVACGDHCWEYKKYDEEHSAAFFAGWMGSSIAPGVGTAADARDLVSAAERRDGVDAGLSSLGLLSGPAATPKTVSKVRQFAARHPTKINQLTPLLLRSGSSEFNERLLKELYSEDIYNTLQRTHGDEWIQSVARQGGDLRGAKRLSEQGVNPEVIKRLSSEGSNLKQIQVGSRVTDSTIDSALDAERVNDMSEVRMITKNPNGKARWLRQEQLDEILSKHTGMGENHVVKSADDAPHGWYPTGGNVQIDNTVKSLPNRMSEEEVVRLIKNSAEKTRYDNNAVVYTLDGKSAEQYRISKMRIVTEGEKGGIYNAYPYVKNGGTAPRINQNGKIRGFEDVQSSGTQPRIPNNETSAFDDVWNGSNIVGSQSGYHAGIITG
ncbi:hypothetical protein HTG_16995 [Natrinema mahii]|nr:hypothetical protein HTG_16995 [Natrinema mahii]